MRRNCCGRPTADRKTRAAAGGTSARAIRAGKAARSAVFSRPLPPHTCCARQRPLFHIYGSGGVAYVSDRSVFVGGSGGRTAVCGAAGLWAGASGGSGPLRRAAAALAFSVSGGVVAAGPVPGGRPVGHPAPARGVVHRGAGSLCGAGPAHRSVRRLCPGSKRGGTGRPHRAAYPAPGGCLASCCFWRS